jgi:integrase
VHSLINLVSRHSKEKPYYQARFYDKSGKPIKSVSLPNIESRAEAYICARQELEQILTSVMPKEEIEQYGILSTEEVKSIVALPENNPNEARNTLIVLLGITCGLGVSEICNLKRNHVSPNDMLMIEAPNNVYRVIPFIKNVKKRLVRLSRFYPDSRYVIPNIRNMDKPCNPISISRGLSSVLSKTGIGKERNIVPSVLQETFITLLVSCQKLHQIDMKILDYLCGFSVSSDMVLSENTKVSITTVITRLMIVLEDLKFITAGDMRWDDPISLLGN